MNRYYPPTSSEHESFVDLGSGEEAIVRFTISGRYIPETWGYDGGTPEEFPEIEITEIVYAADETMKLQFNDVFGDAIDYDHWEQLEREKFERDQGLQRSID